MERKLFVETALDRRTPEGICCSSEVREASKEEIAKFKNAICDHSATELLVYDTGSWLYDFRHCAVCDHLIGMI